jgi:hypothetical protein
MHGPPLYGGSGSGGPYGHAYNGHAFTGGGAYGGNAYSGAAFGGNACGGAMATPPGPLAPVQTHRSAASSRASTPLAAESRVLLEPHAPHSLGSLVLGPGERRLSSGTSSGNGSSSSSGGGGPGSSSGHGGGISLHGVLGGLGAPTTLAALTHGGDDDDGDGDDDGDDGDGAPLFPATTTPSPWSHTAGSAGLVGAGASSRQAQALVHAQASAAALEAARSSGKLPAHTKYASSWLVLACVRRLLGLPVKPRREF